MSSTLEKDKGEDNQDATQSEPSASQSQSPAKKQKTTNASAKSTKTEPTNSYIEKNGQAIFSLSPGKKRVSIGEFKGQVMVNIREYYDKDGEEMPGKAGIALTIEQFESLKSIMPDVDAMIAKKSTKK